MYVDCIARLTLTTLKISQNHKQKISNENIGKNEMGQKNKKHQKNSRRPGACLVIHKEETTECIRTLSQKRYQKQEKLKESAGGKGEAKGSRSLEEEKEGRH